MSERIRRLRPAKVRGAVLAFVGSGLALVGLVILLAGNPLDWFGSDKPKTIFVYCAAGIKPPVLAAAREYEEKFGVHIELQYGGSQTLLSSLTVAKRGDLYIPADSTYIDLARKDNLVEESIPLANMTAVLAFRKDKPIGVKTLQEFLDSNLKVSHANPKAAAVGNLTKRELGKQWPAFEKHIIVTKPTVNEVLNDILTGAVDAGLIWDAVAFQHPKIDYVEITELRGASADITVGVLNSSENATEALAFARYLASRDKGNPKFEARGYTPVRGDKWAKNPTITLYAGAMLQKAIEPTVEEFAKREGVTIKRVYEGCGTLLTMMRTQGKPDVYYSCDSSFMDKVSADFPKKITLTSNPMVLLADKSKNITKLEDLLRPGTRIGLCNPEKSALGDLSWKLLEHKLSPDQFATLKKNVGVQVPKGDLLVTNVRAGALDVAIVYRSNARVTIQQEPDKFQVTKLEFPEALARQPVGIGRDSDFPQLTQRLLDRLRSEPSRKRFLEQGFNWKPETEKP